jgi:hypothetical protein
MPDNIVHFIGELFGPQVKDLDSHRRVFVAVEFHHGGCFEDMPRKMRRSSGSSENTSSSFDSLLVSPTGIHRKTQYIPLIDGYIACT